MRFWINLLFLCLLASCDDSIWPRFNPGSKVVAGAKPQIRTIGRSATWAWITESYPSKPEGMSRCQAGKEVFLRLLEKSNRKFVEKMHVVIGSCHHDIELAENGLQWDPTQKLLTLKILGAKPQTWRYNETSKSFTSE